MGVVEFSFLKNKKFQLLLVVLGLLIIAFVALQFSPSVESISQNITYSDLEVSKNIIFSSSDRVEEYLIDLKNPVVGFLIIPKEIAQDVSVVKTSGEFIFDIIQSDPIIKIESKKYSPGIQKLNVKMPLGEKSLTSILLLIPLIEYNTFTEIEKSELNDLIIQISTLDTNYFSIEESKKMMEEFAQGSASVELKKKVNEKQIFFSENNFGQYTTILQNIITPRQTPIIQENQLGQENTNPNLQIENNFQNISSKLQNILQKRTNNTTIISQTENDYTMTIEFKAEEKDLSLPNEINLFISEEYPQDQFIFEFELKDNDDLNLYNTVLIGNFAEDVNLMILKRDDLFIGTIEINLSKEKVKELNEGEVIEGKIVLEKLFFKKEINLFITKGSCEQKIEKASQQVQLTAEQKKQLIVGCYSEKIKEQADFAQESFDNIIQLQQDMIQDVNLSINESQTSSYYSDQMNQELLNSGMYGGGTSYQLQQDLQVNSKYFANMKLRELFTILNYLGYTDCSWLQTKDSNQLDIILTPKNLFTQAGYNLNILSNSEKRSDKNSLMYYYNEICSINNSLEKANELFKQANTIQSFENETSENKDSLEIQATLYENYSELQIIQTELNSLFIQNKKEQSDYLFKILHFEGINSFYGSTSFVSQPPPNTIPEKGWKYQLKEELQKDYDFLLNQGNQVASIKVSNESSFVNFFSKIKNYPNTPYSNFYYLYFLKRKEMLDYSFAIEKDSSWITRLGLVKNVDEFYKVLATHPTITPEKKEETLELGKNTKNALLEKYLIEDFFIELSDEIDLISALGGKVNEKTFDTESYWKLVYSPATIGEYYARGTNEIFGEGYTDSEQIDLEAYQKRVSNKLHELNMLKVLFNKQLLSESTNTNSNLDFFSRFKEKNSKDTNSRLYFSQRIFVKYLTLEKELSKFNEDNNVDSKYVSNFISKHDEQDYTRASEYNSLQIFPIARIKLVDFIDSQKERPFPNLELVAKAEKQLIEIKPHLTLFEKLENKLLDSFKIGETNQELENATIDYRTAKSIWLNRIDQASDLRYWVAFGIIGKTWQVFKLPTIRTIERAMLSKLFIKNPTFAKILGSKVGTYVYFAGEKLIGRKVSTQILWQRILKNNIIGSTGLITELYGSTLHKEALKLAEGVGSKRIVSLKGGITTVGGFLDASGNKLIIIQQDKATTGISRLIGKKIQTTTQLFHFPNIASQTKAYETTTALETIITKFSPKEAQTLLPILRQVNTSLAPANYAIINSELSALSQLQLQTILVNNGLIITHGGVVALNRTANVAAAILSTNELLLSSFVSVQGEELAIAAIVPGVGSNALPKMWTGVPSIRDSFGKVVNVRLPDALEQLPDELLGLNGVEFLTTNDYLSRTKFANDFAGNGCVTGGCLFQDDYKILIPIDREVFWTPIESTSVPGTIYKFKLNEGMLANVLPHEIAHRGYYNLPTTDILSIANKFTSLTNWTELKNAFFSIPKWKDGYGLNPDFSLVSEMISYTIGYEEAIKAGYKITDFTTQEQFDVIMNKIAPYVGDEIRAAIARGNTDFAAGTLRLKFMRTASGALDYTPQFKAEWAGALNQAKKGVTIIPGTGLENLNSVIFDSVRAMSWAESFSNPIEKSIAQKVANNTKVNSAQEFEEATIEVAKEIITTVGNNNYAVLFDFVEGKSKRWLFEAFKKRLGKQPSFATYFSQKYPNTISDIANSGIDTFVIWDDGTYSGTDAVSKNKFIDAINKYYAGIEKKPNIIVAYSYYTDTAKRTCLAQPNVTFIGIKNMKTLTPVLSSEELALLEKNGFQLSDGTTVIPGLSTETLPHKIPDSHSLVAGEKFVSEKILSGNPLYKDTTLPYVQTEAAQFADYWANGPKNLLDTPINPPQIKSSLLVNQCQTGCTYPVKTSSIINDSTLASQGKLAEGPAVDMSRIESINILQNNIPLNIGITCASPCNVNINNKLERQSNLVKISETTLNESGKEVNLTWTGSIQNVTIRSPQPYEIFSRSEYLDLKEKLRRGAILPNMYTEYINKRVAPSEALINFDNEKMLIITDRQDIAWTINGQPIVSKPAPLTFPKIKPVQSNIINVGDTESSIKSFSNSVKESIFFENISTSSQKTRITIGRETSSGPASIPIYEEEVPVINVNYAQTTKEFYVSSGSRDITGRGNAIIHKNNGETQVVTNIPVNKSGHAIQNPRDFYLDEGDVLEVSQRFFTFVTNSEEKPILLELNNQFNNVFYKNSIILGKPSGYGHIDVFVPGENNPVININKDGDSFYAVSGSRSIRNNAEIINKNGVSETIVNGTEKRYYFENGETISLSGKKFKVEATYDGIKVTPIGTTKQTINFKCSSPCKWENGSSVKIIDSVSDIEVKGDFFQMEKTQIIEYSPELVASEGIAQALQGAPNLEPALIKQIETAMTEGQTIATIQTVSSGRQGILVYAPKRSAIVQEVQNVFDNLYQNSVASGASDIEADFASITSGFGVSYSPPDFSKTWIMTDNSREADLMRTVLRIDNGAINDFDISLIKS
jgi:hypothetical protein